MLRQLQNISFCPLKGGLVWPDSNTPLRYGVHLVIFCVVTCVYLFTASSLHTYSHAGVRDLIESSDGPTQGVRNGHGHW